MKRFLGLLGLALLTQSFICANAHAGPGHHDYYPLSFQRLLDKKVDTKSLELSKADQEILRQEMFEVLSRYHQKVNGGPDKLGCAQSESAKCYRHQSLGYRGARKVLFGKIHLREDNRGYYVKDVYCGTEFTRSRTNVGPNIIPNSNVLNCEHTWPQSKFSTRFNKDMQKSDLHHLYPTDSKANSIRGNYHFAEVQDNLVHNLCNSSRSSGDRFEPPTEHKGNVARALFYFAVRYQMNIPADEEAYLREWHYQDPVDADERQRNETIFQVQKNRNPFIDYPGLVDKIANF